MSSLPKLINMKIRNVIPDTKRYQKGKVYIIEYVPNFFQRLFGVKPVFRKFLQEREYHYKYYPEIQAVVDEYGNTLSIKSPEVLAIIRFQRSENLFQTVDETFPEENPL